MLSQWLGKCHLIFLIILMILPSTAQNMITITETPTKLPGSVFTNSPMPASFSVKSSSTSTVLDKEQNVIQLVQNAITLIKKLGKDMAFAEFNRNPGFFSKGNIYVFAIDFDGNILADGNDANLIGKNALNLKNSHGEFVYQLLTEKAKNGGGWVQYRDLNPDNNRVECKKSFVLQGEHEYYIGSGFYYSPNAEGNCS